MMRIRIVALLGVLAAACSSTPPEPEGDPYVYKAPPATGAPAGLDSTTWQQHLDTELMPYWRMPEAQGPNPGNFPAWRRMDGQLTTNTARKPRMMGRQIYAYAVGFLLTGDEALLDQSRAGTRWLLDHAQDKTSGGWYPDLDVTGNPTGTDYKYSQDLAYDVMGPAAYFYVTRDAEAEQTILAARDLLFDPAKYWDAANGRIKDGLDRTMSREVVMGNADGWELVAQLDPITAFLLLSQPALTDPARRDQVLGDLRTLATRIHDSFWKDGFFWGTTGNVGAFGSWHSDFGHMLKSYWALTQIDKRLPDQPFRAFLRDNTARTLKLAFDKDYGRWASVPTSATTVRYGNDWWSYAESDQLAATLALHDPSWIDVLSKTAVNFRADFVDHARPARELVSSIKRDGSGYGWPDSDTAKCNEWKSGFHSTEHALVMYLFGHWLEGTPAPLYFAFPPAQIQELAARTTPYTFQGRVAQVEDLGALQGDPTRHKVRVSFDQLR